MSQATGRTQRLPVARGERRIDQQAQVGSIPLACEIPACVRQRSGRIPARMQREQAFLALVRQGAAATDLLERGIDPPAPRRCLRAALRHRSSQPHDQARKRGVGLAGQRQRTFRLAMRQQRLGQPRSRLLVRPVERVRALETLDRRTGIAGTQGQVRLGRKPPARNGDGFGTPRIECRQEPARALERSGSSHGRRQADRARVGGTSLQDDQAVAACRSELPGQQSDICAHEQRCHFARLRRESAIEALPRGVEVVALLRQLRRQQVDCDRHRLAILPGPDDCAGPPEKARVAGDARDAQELRSLASGGAGVARAAFACCDFQRLRQDQQGRLAICRTMAFRRLGE